MKNYGLQVKEIPMIFRGTLTAGKKDFIPNTILDAYDGAFDDFNYQNVADEALTADTVNVIYNGQEYKNLIKVSKEYDDGRGNTFTHHFYNANPSEYSEVISDIRIDTNIPFFIVSSEFPAMNDYYTAVYFLTDYEMEYPEYQIQIIESDPDGGRALFRADITGNGQINHFRARFACGENGTLHLRPYVILNGNIRVDLCNFAQSGDQYIAGDNEEIEFSCYVPVETHAVAYVEAENVGEYPSLVDAAMTVQYEDFIEPESIVGYEGVNLRRGRR